MDIKIATGLAYEDLVLAHNLVEINVDPADLSIVDRSKIRYYLTVQVRPFQNADTWETLPRMDGVEELPETVGGATIARGAFFNIEKLLASYVDSDAPVFGQNRILPAADLIRPFRYIERIENNGVLVRETTSKVMYAIAAGVNERYLPTYGKTFFSEFIGKTRGFLSYSPVFSVLPDQDTYLYFLNNLRPNAQAIKLRVYCHYLDGTMDPEPETKMVTLTQDMNVFSIPVSPAVLGLADNVSTYTVWLLNENDAMITAMKTFRINREHFENTKTLIFKNSLGGYDSLACVGRASETLTLYREETQRFRDFEAPAQFSEVVINEVTGERQLTISTGWITPAVREWLEELVLSTEIFIKTDRDYLPIKLVEEQYASSDSKEYLIGRTFVFSYTNKETSYSNLPLLPAKAERPTWWRAYAYGGCELDAYGKRTGKRHVTHLEKYYTDDNTAVKPMTVKANSIGTEGFLAPSTHSSCASAAFTNTAYTAAGTYKKQTCATGLYGGPATISIPAGRWGSENNQQEANDKALAEWNALNTQAYANANGTCNAMAAGGLRAKFYTYTPDSSRIPPANIFQSVPLKTEVLTSIILSDEILTSKGLPADYVAMNAVGYIKAPVTGPVTFYLESDDGKRFYMSETPAGALILKIDDWYNQSANEKQFTINMVVDIRYKIEIHYFEHSAASLLNARWSYQGQEKTAIPSTNMYYE